MLCDERYLRLSSHVRVAAGLDIEEKCNLIVAEEESYGYVLVESSVSCVESSDGYPVLCSTIVLIFHRK